MNTKSWPSLYRYVMFRRSTVAVSTFVPALNVLSTTLPVSTCLSVVRTKAPPLPGLTCWNAVTVHSWPSRLRTSPFFRSLVVATSLQSPVSIFGSGPLSNDHEVLGAQGEEFGLPSPHDERVLDAHATAPREVDAGLDGDRHTGGQCTDARRGEAGRLVDLQADAVAETVCEVLAVPRLRDHLPRRGVHIGHLGAGHDGTDPGRLGGVHEFVDLSLPVRGLAEDEGAGHVGVVAVDGRAEVHLDEVAALELGVRRLVVRDRRVRAGGDDGGEAGLGRAVLQHPVLQVTGDFQLGTAGPQAPGGDEVVQRPVGGAHAWRSASISASSLTSRSRSTSPGVRSRATFSLRDSYSSTLTCWLSKPTRP